VNIALQAELSDFASFDVIVVPVFAPKEAGKDKAFLPQGISRSLAEGIEHSGILNDFQAAPAASLPFYSSCEGGARRLMLVGLGGEKGFKLDGLRKVVASAISACDALNLQKILLDCSWLGAYEESLAVSKEKALGEAAFGALVSLYSFMEFKTEGGEGDKKAPEALTILTGAVDEKAAEEAVLAAEAGMQGVKLARDLINRPSNTATPVHLAETAEGIAERYGFRVHVMDVDEVEGLGMGCFAAVFRGSRADAKFITLDTAPQGMEDDHPIVLVGKGVTFDTGGISLKPSKGMEEMKGDMGGAAAVLGFFEAWGRLGLKRRVVGLVPCTDNMPDAHATKPGDVVTSHSGKTVEIINTDAEGRLLLCDALSYSEKYAPKLIIDLATLTGACVVALGSETAGLFSAEDDLAEHIAKTGDMLGEKFWRLPLWDSFFEPLKSDTADMKNVGSREGGAIHAALFLKQFVPEGTAWAHIDIAGPSWADGKSPVKTKGGVGFGVRTLLELVKNGDDLPLGTP
jgi:leucyl aminopeptidase